MSENKALRWVKASDRWPSYEVRVFYRIHYPDGISVWCDGHLRQDSNRFREDAPFLEWLEEYEIAPTKEGASQQAPGEASIPEEIMQWIDKEIPLQEHPDPDEYGYPNRAVMEISQKSGKRSAIAMYRKLQESLPPTENPLASYWFETSRTLLVDRNDFKAQLKRSQEEIAAIQSQLSSITAQRDEAVKISDEYRLVIKAMDESRSNVMTERDAALKEVVETRAALDKVMDTLKRQRTNNPDTEYAGWNAGVAIQNKYKKEEQK